mmetsp:Transcript_4596/g.7023  ORF Transcript_4596/g.7023 Transcript_4596/m.7023 type:complete len:296 (+) Transcript_4596:1633-2520(+)
MTPKCLKVSCVRPLCIKEKLFGLHAYRNRAVITSPPRVLRVAIWFPKKRSTSSIPTVSLFIGPLSTLACIRSNAHPPILTLLRTYWDRAVKTLPALFTSTSFWESTVPIVLTLEVAYWSSTVVSLPSFRTTALIGALTSTVIEAPSNDFVHAFTTSSHPAAKRSHFEHVVRHTRAKGQIRILDKDIKSLGLQIKVLARVGAVSIKLHDTCAILPNIICTIPYSKDTVPFVGVHISDILDIGNIYPRLLVQWRPLHSSPVCVRMTISLNFWVHITRVIIGMRVDIISILPVSHGSN